MISKKGVKVTDHTQLGERAVYEIEADFGHMDVVYSDTTGWYTISNIDVDEAHRRKGIGKELLRFSIEHARSLGATAIVSSIVSRECLDAAEAVFGQENIQVLERGEYLLEDSQSQNKYTASAYLEMRLT